MKQKEYEKKLKKTKQVISNNGKNPSSEVMRVPKELAYEFEKLGKGEVKRTDKIRRGMKIALIAINTQGREKILMNECNRLMDHIKVFYGDNHYWHFDSFPAFFNIFLKKGKIDEEDLEVLKKGEK